MDENLFGHFGVYLHNMLVLIGPIQQLIASDFGFHSLTSA